MSARTAALYRSYAQAMKLLGFERSIARFLMQLDVALPADASILDVGCGTGIIGLTLMRRCPRGTLVATDVNRDLLEETKQNAMAHGVDGRVTLGVSDISRPDVLVPINGSPPAINGSPRASAAVRAFDVVATGAVIGYSRDQERTIHTLLDMVKPDGCFLNIEMNETLVGRLTSRRYRYPVMPLSHMAHVIESHGFEVTRVEVRTFPARLTRTCYLARKR